MYISRRLWNRVARYSAGVTLLFFLFLLACITDDGSNVAQALALPAFLLFGLSVIVFLGTYGIHLVWMVKERAWHGRIGGSITLGLLMLLGISGYEIYAQAFSLKNIPLQAAWVFLVVLFGEVSWYVFAWKE